MHTREPRWFLFLLHAAEPHTLLGDVRDCPGCRNQMYIVGVNTTGKTPVDTYSGASITADPHGVIISRAHDAEQLLFSDIDPGEVERTRNAFPVAHDFRDSLYHTLIG